ASASLVPCGGGPFGPWLTSGSPAVLTLGLLVRTVPVAASARRPHSFRAAAGPAGLGSPPVRPPYSLSASLYGRCLSQRRRVGLTRSVRRRALRALAHLRFARRTHSRPPCTDGACRSVGASASLVPCGGGPCGPWLTFGSPAVLILGLPVRTVPVVASARRPHSFRAAAGAAGLGSPPGRPSCSPS